MQSTPEGSSCAELGAVAECADFPVFGTVPPWAQEEVLLQEALEA